MGEFWVAWSEFFDESECDESLDDFDESLEVFEESPEPFDESDELLDPELDCPCPDARAGPAGASASDDARKSEIPNCDACLRPLIRPKYRSVAGVP